MPDIASSVKGSYAWVSMISRTNLRRRLVNCRQVRKTRHQLYKHIDADYYGFRDEEDGTLVKAEAAAEAQLQKKVHS